jgi:hypothetical protein
MFFYQILKAVFVFVESTNKQQLAKRMKPSLIAQTKDRNYFLIFSDPLGIIPLKFTRYVFGGVFPLSKLQFALNTHFPKKGLLVAGEW